MLDRNRTGMKRDFGCQPVGASSGAAFAALCPAMTAILGIPILGEWPSAVEWIAICTISAGVYVVSGGPLPMRWR
jgi:drug/metabolite transporter (DMT)-like permease